MMVFRSRLGDNRVRIQLRDTVLVQWPAVSSFRLFDERADELGPYYFVLGHDGAYGELGSERTLRPNGERHPIAMLQFGLEEHVRWKRSGDERAREIFLAQARWAVAAQRESVGVRGSYEFPFASRRFGCAAGFRSATAQGQAVSLLLRAYQETGEGLFLERAIDAAVPLTVDLCDGGVLWQAGDDLIFEGAAGAVPSHILSGWIYGLWAMFELSRTTKLDRIDTFYRQSLATLEKYLRCYDSGTWSYENLLVTPTGLRRMATVRRHLIHITQLTVLLSMAGNERFAAAATRWRRYSISAPSRLQAWTDGVVSSLALLDPLSIPSGARSVI